MKSLFKTLVLSILCLFFIVPVAQADLFISPLRVVFEGRDRSALVTLLNRSQEINTYRIYWKDKVFNPETNNYQDVEALGTAGGGVSEMIRYSPRQITLRPGENQKIRLAVRKPGDLADGEYRSHLVFEKVPDIPDESLTPKEGATLKLYVNLSFAIPIYVRQGISVDTLQASISNTSIRRDRETNNPVIDLTISKSDPTQSAIGKIMVYNVDAGGKQGSVIGILNNAGVLKELTSRDFSVELSQGPITGNQIYVVYKGDDEFSGIVWDEQIINLN